MKNILLVIVGIVYLHPQALSAEASCSSCVQESIQAVQKNSVFERFIRPPLRTMKIMTSTLSWILGAATIIACLDWLDRRESLTSDQKKGKIILIAAWIANKTLYHLSEYALEEMNNKPED